MPAELISVKPHFVYAPAVAELERRARLFVGRLSGAKGIAVLLDALDWASLPAVDVASENARSGLLGAAKHL